MSILQNILFIQLVASSQISKVVEAVCHFEHVGIDRLAVILDFGDWVASQGLQGCVVSGVERVEVLERCAVSFITVDKVGRS